MATIPAGESAVHLRFVGKVALIFAAVATAGLVALLLVVSEDPGLGYGPIIGARLRSQARLELTLWLFGLLLAALSGLTTWLLALYASFRFAGPVWRFSRNLEQAIQRGPVPPIPLRRDDLLQRESADLRAAAEGLQAQYQLLREALARWQADPSPEPANTVIACLKAIDSRARL